MALQRNAAAAMVVCAVAGTALAGFPVYSGSQYGAWGQPLGWALLDGALATF